MANIRISTDTVKKDFDDFLGIKENSRIFFSGQFGIGKTYFLNEFFDSLKEKYDVFHLYPVNYQISSNEDILELIKYDILIELLKKNKDILTENEVDGIKESSFLFYSWVKKRFSINSTLQSTISFGESLTGTFFNPVFNSFERLGRPLKDLLELDKEFQEFKNEYKEGEKGLVAKYTEQIKAKNISETDYFSHLLKEKIIEQKDGKKSVLVLDDLDRIDPDHVFRILNILSAYFEKECENKFGFDSIIIVADYTNLKHFFHHKYGNRSDFSGYIDKFFSISPFYFDNKKAVFDRIEEITKSTKSEEPNLDGAINDSGYIKLFLWHIFSNAISGEIMNLRSLLKATKFQLLELKKGSYYQDHYDDNFKKIFDIAIKIAIHSFSSTEIFIKKIEIIKNSKTKKEQMMPYPKYITSMLKSFNLRIPDEKDAPIVWKNYTIIKSEYGFEVSGDKEEQLFYDLLISYLEEKKYLENNYRDY